MPGTALEEIELELTAGRVAKLSSPPLVKVGRRTVVDPGPVDPSVSAS